MKIGTYQIYGQLANYMNQDISTITKLEDELSSGKKFTRNSDDVISVVSSMDYNMELSQDNRYSSGINSATTMLSDASTAMSSTLDALNQAKEVALEGLNGTSSAQDRAAMAQQVYQIRDELLGFANTKTADGQSVFAGLKTDQSAFDSSTYAYNGDAGVMNANISNSQLLPVNVPGSTAFAYTLSGPVSVQQADGSTVTYSMSGYPPPSGDTTINVQITDASGNTLDKFSFSNFMQLTGLLGDALNSNNTTRISALLTPFDDAISQATSVSSDIGARQNRLTAQQSAIENDTLNAQTLLSSVQDDDVADTTTQLAKYQAILQSIRETTATDVSQSLLDFLK
ncbi:MAG: flagellar hook-associated protein FlgL [Nitrospiraceae bacterium]|nr:flagellar hook-associated protein FlgL [Nitrospiraceae bacterium]